MLTILSSVCEKNILKGFSIMDDFYTELMTASFSELQQDSIRNLRRVDPEYNNLRLTHAGTSKEYEKMIGDLPQENKALAEKFNGDVCRIHDRERDFVYLQGYKDCIKFFRLIEVIS